MNQTKQSSVLAATGLGLMLGGGAYTGARGIRDLMAAKKPKKEDSRDVLEIAIPRSKFEPEGEKKHEEMVATAETSTGELLASGVGLAGGAAAGYFGARKLYDMYKNKELDDEKSKKEKVYSSKLEHISKIQTKEAKEKSCTDYFCLGMQAELTKSAFHGHDPMTSLMGGVTDLTTAGVHGGMHIGKAMAGGISESAPDTMAWLKALAAAGVLTTAGVTYGLGMAKDKKKEEEIQIPERVRAVIV